MIVTVTCYFSSFLLHLCHSGDRGVRRPKKHRQLLPGDLQTGSTDAKHKSMKLFYLIQTNLSFNMSYTLIINVVVNLNIKDTDFLQVFINYSALRHASGERWKRKSKTVQN